MNHLNPTGASAQRALILCAAALLGISSLTLRQATAAEGVGPGYDLEMSRMIPMRDGVTLESWITKPSHAQKPMPTVFTLTQYDIDGGRHGDSAAYYARRGYAFVQVYVRGRGRSGGVKNDSLGLQVGQDGYDVVEWIAKQPWSDGRVVMFGGSFVGMTQWRTAAQLPPHLAGIAPYVPIYPGWDVPNTNGIPQSWSAVIMGYTSGRSLNDGFIANEEYWHGKMLEQYAAYKPFGELDTAIGIAADDWWMIDARGKKLSFMNMWLDHVGDAAFNLAAEPRDSDFTRMQFPVLSATGYFDDDQPGALRYYRRHVAHAPASAVAQHYLIIGPWDHSGTQRPTKEIDGLAIPEAAVLDMNRLHADWYDWVLGRGPRPELLKDRVSYFMMGANEWRYAPTLESASSGKNLDLYMDDSGGTPRDLFHSGALSATLPVAEPPALLVSDPHELPAVELARFAADEDAHSQFRALQKRAISFHSEPFADDTEIAGHIHLTIDCTADAPDFDLWAQLLLIEPDGITVRLGEDIRRARFRNDPFHQELLQPGQIVQIPFEFKWIAWRFPAGSRLRLTLAPLNSPDYQKNFNTGGRIGYERIDDARVANIQILHQAGHASRLTLPLAAAR